MSYFERKEKQIEMQRKMCVGTCGSQRLKLIVDLLNNLLCI